jgi:hypothetical protein
MARLGVTNREREANVILPLYGFVEGDVLGLLVVVHDNETVGDLAKKLLEAAAVRTGKYEKGDVFFKRQRLDPTAAIGRVGLSALDRVDVVPRRDR